MQKTKLCSGFPEKDILPLLSNFAGSGNLGYIMVLIEMVEMEVVYRARKCAMVARENVCDACQEMLKDLKMDQGWGNIKQEIGAEKVIDKVGFTELVLTKL